MLRLHPTRALFATTLLSVTSLAGFDLAAQDTLFYSAVDGSVRGLDASTRREVVRIFSAALGGGGQGGVRQLAFDAGTNTLWYTGLNGTLQSIDVRTRRRGATIQPVSIPGGATSQPRRLAIDHLNRRLFVSLRTGGVAIFRLGRIPLLFGTIPAGAFLGTNPREFRKFAADVRTGNLWYAASDSTIRELSVQTMRNTGRFIARGELIRGGSGIFRSFTIDPVRDLLIFASNTGGVDAVNLTTLRLDPFALPGNLFNGASGIARILASGVRGALGSVANVGFGCRGTFRIPQLSTFFGRVPVVGRSFVMSARAGTPSGAAMMQIGPIIPPRAVAGAPGCTLYVLPVRLVPLTSRFAVFSTLIPRDASLVGRTTGYQMVVPDPGANAAGRVYSNALRTVVGTHAPAFSFGRLRFP